MTLLIFNVDNRRRHVERLFFALLVANIEESNLMYSVDATEYRL